MSAAGPAWSPNFPKASRTCGRKRAPAISQIPWALTGSASSRGSASSCLLVTGVPTSWSSNGRWQQKIFLPPQRTPLIAAFPKVLFPAITVLPGMLALVLVPQLGSNRGDLSYNQALPLMLMKFYPPGMLGIGLTAMLASFMSGMAGNITAFNTVWTYDIYKSYIKKDGTDKHYLWMGRLATAVGIVVSIFTAFIVMSFESIMDYMQLIFSFVNAPLFATFLLGMFWKRTTPWGAFYGLVAGTLGAGVMYLLEQAKVIGFPSPMAGNFWRSAAAWVVCFLITIVISFFTKPKPIEELQGLVWGTGPKFDFSSLPWYKRPAVLAAIVAVMTLACNLLFW
jgi:solute:Na+ symporter, SSS family